MTTINKLASGWPDLPTAKFCGRMMKRREKKKMKKKKRLFLFIISSSIVLCRQEKKIIIITITGYNNNIIYKNGRHGLLLCVLCNKVLKFMWLWGAPAIQCSRFRRNRPNTLRLKNYYNAVFDTTQDELWR